ncbi:MAG: hypothetical protein ACOX2K_05110 [Bacillota bacterium]|jgi:hypothetical protein
MDGRALPRFTAKCLTDQEPGGFHFTFFCALCNHSYTVSLFASGSLQSCLRLAEQEARLHFNRCTSCHRWVCDEHYDEDVMKCTICAPRAR